MQLCDPSVVVFERRHFCPRDHHSLRAVVHHLQTELPRFVGDDGRARHRCGAYHYSAVGAALYPRIQEALAALARPVGSSWLIDETYLKIKGKWTSLYRSVDKGLTLPLLTQSRSLCSWSLGSHAVPGQPIAAQFTVEGDTVDV
jgi:hypothetical protein